MEYSTANKIKHVYFYLLIGMMCGAIITGWLALFTIPNVWTMDDDTGIEFSHLSGYKKDKLLLKKILKDIPNNVQFVDLSYNYIKTIPSGSFAYLASCLHLFLTINKISEIGSGVFKVLTSLESLHLDYNFMTELRSNMWTGISSLHLLDWGK